MKIPYSVPYLCGNEEKYVSDAVRSTWISGGKYVTQLEKWLSDNLFTKHALVVSNGTTALHLAFLGLGIKPGDEVIVPGFAFMAAANVLINMNVVPVFADVDSDTWCVTAESIEAKITKKTKAVVPIHTYGNICSMETIKNLGLLVIEDGAEALFSKYKGKCCGTFGDVGTFSMHATKTITTGEGGFVVCDSDDVAQFMATIRSHGLPIRGCYNHVLAGHNFRLTNMQAALGCAQVENVDNVISERRRVFDTYKVFLEDKEGIRLQQYNSDVDPVVWATAASLDTRTFPQGRDGVVAQLNEFGVETRPGFVASSRLQYFERHSVPVSEVLGDNVISFPTYPSLSNNDIADICECLLSVRS